MRIKISKEEKVSNVFLLMDLLGGVQGCAQFSKEERGVECRILVGIVFRSITWPSVD